MDIGNHMKKIAWLLLSLISLGFNACAVADQCTAVFPAAVQSTLATTGNITFTCGSQVISNSTPTNSLPTPTLTNPSGCGTNTCPTANCTATGFPVNTLSVGAFQASSGAGGNFTVSTNQTATIDNNNNITTDYNTVLVMPNATLNFSANPSGGTLYRINTLDLRNNATVNFIGGDYWIGTLTTSGGQTKVITTTGTTRLFILNNMTVTKGLVWNTASTADQFFIYGYGSFSITSATSQINAILYSQQNITLGQTALTGAITAQNVTLNTNSTVAYDATAVNNLNFGSVCQTTQFVVSAPATATNCQNTTVTVTAQNAGGQTVTNYTGTITLDTQTGSGMWVSTSGSGAFSGNVNNGLATYTFVTGDNGVASFQLSYPGSGSSPVTVKAYQTNNTNIFGLSGAINFVSAGLSVTDVAVSNPPAAPPPAFSTTQTAGSDFNLYLTAINENNCDVNTSYAGAKNIRFYTTYINPTTGTMNATINGTTIASSSGAATTTQSINFTSGVATVTGRYNDAGQLSLNVIDTAVSPAGPTGVSGNFVVKPASFAMNIPGNTATQATSPAGAAQTACLADAVFAKAGNNFTVNVQPRNALGNVTPNYGNETSPQGIILTSGSVLGPTGGRNGSANNGAIGNGSTFTKITSGSPTPPAGWSYPYFQGTTFSFDEVGCINLTAGVSGGNYLSASNGAVTGSLVVGRFTPDHFDTSGNTPQFTTTCTGGGGSFTYLDQPFVYATQPVLTVLARALAGTTTQNYTGSFWKLTSSGFGSVYNKAYFPVTGGDTIPALNLSATIPAPTFVDVGAGVPGSAGSGTGTFTFADGGGLKIQRLVGTLSPPLTAEIQLRVATITDSDSVACTGTGCSAGGFSFGATTSGNGIAFAGTGGGKQFYHGRLNVINASGSEILPLTVPMQTEYYTSANGFVLNSLDTGSSGNCTVYTGGATNLVVTPSSGLSTTATVSGSPTYYFSGGALNISLSAPTGTTTGYADIEASIGTILPWLQYNWSYTGTLGTTYSNNPRGRGTFGIFKGNDRVIYQKEVTQ